ncbi:MAG TPA: class I SAM-dependent methyltransferase [Ruminiclostridium sp.]|nr:class I SAM-dependent methyltransferase [Ruminiclostridium sp.]
MLIAPERIPEQTEEVADGRHYLKRVKEMMIQELYPFFIERIIKEAGFGPGRALEIGPGPLPMGFYLCRRSLWEVTGAEISPDMVEIGRKTMKEEDRKAHYSMVIANAENLPFPDGSFNLIFSSGSLHHWLNPVKVFREINRVLAPGGKAMIFDLSREVYSDEAEYQRIMGTVKEEFKQGLLESLKAAYLPGEIMDIIRKSGNLSTWQRIQTEQYHCGMTWLNQCVILQKALNRRVRL